MATTPAVRALIHELATPLTVLITASELLGPRTPAVIAEPLQHLRELSQQFGQEVIALRADLDQQIDGQSAIRAAQQLRQRASDWRHRYAKPLTPLLDQLQATTLSLPEPLLERLLHQSLPSGLSELDRVLTRLEALQAEDLETS